MLDECLRIFKQELKDNTNLVLNTIILADGDYVLVHDDGTYDVEKIKFDGMENKGHNGISTDCEERIECGYWL